MLLGLGFSDSERICANKRLTIAIGLTVFLGHRTNADIQIADHADVYRSGDVDDILERGIDGHAKLIIRSQTNSFQGVKIRRHNAISELADLRVIDETKGGNTRQSSGATMIV